MDEKILKDIKDSLEMIVFILFLNVLATQCSGPSMSNVERSLDLGTLRPKEINHGKHGTKVTWSLVELDAHEHRIITYKVRAKLNILGTFSLPRAGVEYGKGKRGKGKAYSNIFRVDVE